MSYGQIHKHKCGETTLLIVIINSYVSIVITKHFRLAFDQFVSSLDINEFQGW